MMCRSVREPVFSFKLVAELVNHDTRLTSSNCCMVFRVAPLTCRKSARGAMSVAGLKYAGAQQWGHSSPAETKSGSYIYAGSASAYHDWEFRTRIRVLQHKEKQKRELLKDLRMNSQAGARSQSPRKWGPKRAGGTEHPGLRSFGLDGDGRPTEGESSGIPASPSSARRRRIASRSC